MDITFQLIWEKLDEISVLIKSINLVASKLKEKRCKKIEGKELEGLIQEVQEILKDVPYLKIIEELKRRLNID